jgi:REP element-mobilizing transposase RayT
MEFAQRNHPAHGVIYFSNKPTIVYVTVCTKDRRPWLATPDIHATLREVWTAADAWHVGRYVIMPDHFHLFAAPNEHFVPFVEVDNWSKYCKSQFSKRHKNATHRWQTDHWDTRLRSDESYESKWEYTRYNPVRAGLVAGPDDWPLQGEIMELRWE